ncbi:hypothetical protein [Halovivax sp.]|uniref:hypothetical protein n=1 Tax=Halovivax sp. TaxID=1935978 RepID=UPI0025B9A646|nr:hypothetical protein [Halovivax sp.]
MMDRDINDILGRHGFGRVFASIGRYDLLLAVIPLAFAVGVAAAEALGIPLRTALVGASLVGLLALVDGLFIRPPSGLSGA